MGERGVVALVSGVGEDAADAGTGQRLNVGKDGFERVAVIRPSWQRLGVGGELAAFAAVERGGDGSLDAELVRSVGFAS